MKSIRLISSCWPRFKWGPFLLAFHAVALAGWCAAHPRLAELEEAVHAGDVRQVSLLLKQYPDLVRDRSEDGWRPFFFGAGTDETNMAELFLVAGADVKQRNDSGETALHYAAMFRSVTGVRALLKAGADVNARASCRETPIMKLTWALGDGPTIPVAELLIQRGADVNATDDLGNTVLHLLSSSDDAPLVKYLLENGANPNITNKVRCTPLMWAALNNKSNLTRLYEARGLRLAEVFYDVEPSDVRSNSVFVSSLGECGSG